MTEKIDPQKQMDFKYLELNLSLTEHSKFGFYFLFFFKVNPNVNKSYSLYLLNWYIVDACTCKIQICAAQ